MLNHFQNICKKLEEIQQKNSINLRQIVVPELDTFEELLVSIDDESKTNDKKNGDERKIEEGEEGNFDFDFGFNIDVKSLQEHMKTLNKQIKNELSSQEIGQLLKS